MELYREVNLLDNKKLIAKVNRWSMGILLVSIPVFVAMAYLFLDLAEAKLRVSDFFVASILCFVIIIIHEGIHGIFFKVFKPDANVIFGFKAGMAYAGSPGNKYNSKQILWILLSPFTLITTGIFLLTQLNIMSVFVFIFLGMIHTAACVGDFYFAYLILKTPGKVIVEDTNTGINIYQKLD